MNFFAVKTKYNININLEYISYYLKCNCIYICKCICM